MAGKILKLLEERKENSALWKTINHLISVAPQGSVLGAILFLIYVSYINEGLTCRI